MEIDTTSQPVTYIYALIDPRKQDTITAIRYIGKATGSPSGRYREHISCAYRGIRTHCYSWIRNLRVAGLVPTQRILEIVPLKDGAEAERRWIRSLREQGADLTNLTDGGDGIPGYRHSDEAKLKIAAGHMGIQTCLGHHHSEETRAKISMANAGRKHSPEWCAKIAAVNVGRKPSIETRAKLSIAGMGNKNALGHHPSAETRAKVSAALRGRRFSSETLAKMSAAFKGRKFSPEHRARLSVAGKGKKLSSETRANISTALRGRHCSEETRAKMVLQIHVRKRDADGKFVRSQ